ncbi:MAG: hypothetical protein ACRDSN_17450, partial [Pseudonocardiaceae bacterium]
MPTDVPHAHGAMTSTDLATLTIGQRDELADLLDKIAWSVDHAGRSGELYPGEPRYQRAHEAGCWGWIADT